MIAPGDLVRWIGAPMEAGKGWIVIRRGDMLRVAEVRGVHLALHLPDGGVFAWTGTENVEKVNEL
jgi:hypothetical protein